MSGGMAIKCSRDSKCSCTTVQAEGATEPCSFQNTPLSWNWTSDTSETFTFMHAFRGFSLLCLKDTYLLLVNKCRDKNSRLMRPISLSTDEKKHVYTFFLPYPMQLANGFRIAYNYKCTFLSPKKWNEIHYSRNH